MSVCGRYLGDNDGTCPQLTCTRDWGHGGLCDNVFPGPDCEACRRPGQLERCACCERDLCPACMDKPNACPHARGGHEVRRP